MGRIQPGQTHHDPPQFQGQTPPPAAPVQYPPPQIVHVAPPPPQYNHHYRPVPLANHNPTQYKVNPTQYKVNPTQYGGGPGQPQYATPLTPHQTGNYGYNGGPMMVQNMSPMTVPHVGPVPASRGLQMPKMFQGRGGFVGTNPWMTGLFDCMEDPLNAFVTTLFPCVTFGQIADVLDNGHTTCVTSGIIYGFSPCTMSRGYRTKLRKMFGLVEAPAADWIVHTFFEPCALCQAHRELSKRGIDPALGYLGNREKLLNQQGVGFSPTMAPPTPQTMM